MKKCETCVHWKPSSTKRNQETWGDCKYLTSRHQDPYVFDLDISCLCEEVDEDTTDVETKSEFGCICHDDGVEKDKPGYTFQQFYIPHRMMFGIKTWINERKLPGDFLQAVIKNDLKNAVGYADDENVRNLPAYVAYFYNEAPSLCWGSEKRMNEWMKGG